MKGHYFNIETYSKNDKPDSKTDKIITIQFQKIDLETGNSEGKLQILKEWEEGGEEKMLKFIHKWFFERNPWQFIPIGFNLNFEWNFLCERFKKYGIDNSNLSHYFNDFPQIDLKPFAVLKMGGFKGANLQSISNNLNEDGNIVKKLYEKKEYDKIVQHIKNKSKSFLETYSKISKIIQKEL